MLVACLLMYPLISLFDLILKKIYVEKTLTTTLPQEDMKTLLELCTKSLHFSFNGRFFQQVDGVAMGSPLGPVIANIFMAELEEQLVPTLGEKMSIWLRFVDDTFTLIKEKDIVNVLNTMNDFHPSINFTYEVETEKNLPFLDVNITRTSDGSFKTSVYRKSTASNIYMHWKAHGPKIWKTGTLKGLFKRAFMVSSDQDSLKTEINFLKTVFCEVNGYPKNVVQNCLKIVKQKIMTEGDLENVPATQPVQDPEDLTVSPHIILPYKGYAGETMVKSLKKLLTGFLPKNVSTRIIFKG